MIAFNNLLVGTRKQPCAPHQNRLTGASCKPSRARSGLGSSPCSCAAACGGARARNRKASSMSEMSETLFDYDRLDVYRLAIRIHSRFVHCCQSVVGAISSCSRSVAASRTIDPVSLALKRKLIRIVSMLTRLAIKFNGVAESQAEYKAVDDYEHEHEGEPEQRH
jgi:hypothetical protein